MAGQARDNGHETRTERGTTSVRAKVPARGRPSKPTRSSAKLIQQIVLHAIKKRNHRDSRIDPAQPLGLIDHEVDLVANAELRRRFLEVPCRTSLVPSRRFHQPVNELIPPLAESRP